MSFIYVDWLISIAAAFVIGLVFLAMVVVIAIRFYAIFTLHRALWKVGWKEIKERRWRA